MRFVSAVPGCKTVVSMLLLAALCAPSAAQEPKPQDEDQAVETFKVAVNVVNLLFNVKTKKNGALVPNLTKDGFEVFEDGKPQTIKYFTAETNLPLTLGILFDTSGSQRHVLDMQKQIGGAFLRELMTAKDLAFVISFDVQVELLQDFTSDVRQLRESFKDVKVNVGGKIGGMPGAGGGPFPQQTARGTLLFDAVYLASQEKLRNEVGRKAMILFTDGQDQGSKMKLRDAIEAAQKADAICYTILVFDRGAYDFGGYGGDDDMKKLTEQTGGRLIEVGDDAEKLRKAFDEIGAELRAQYSIGYTPTNATKDGSFRKVEIKSKQGYYIQSRKGYYAAEK